jgi:predicted transcriptional regulator
VAHHPNLSDLSVQVFAVLARFAGRDGRCWPSRETVAAAAGCSVRSVDRALGELAAAGLIERASRGNGHGGRTSTLYTLDFGGGAWAAVPEAALAGSSRAVRLVAVLDLMADRNGVCEPSRGRLAELLDCSTDSIDRALAELAEAGVVVRLPAAGKTGRLRLPHRPARPAAPVDSPTRTAPAPSAPVAANPPHEWQEKEIPLNENAFDDGGYRESAVEPAAAAPPSSDLAPPSPGGRSAWRRATCRVYAGIVASTRTDLANPHAFTATVARQALDERAGRLVELHAAGLTPEAAAELLHLDGPAPPPPPSARREPRPFGDPDCPACDGGGWVIADRLAARCGCVPGVDPIGERDLVLGSLPPFLAAGETAASQAEALAAIRAIRQQRKSLVGSGPPAVPR